MKKSLRMISAVMSAVMMFSVGGASVYADWQDTDDGKIYLDENNRKVTGFQTIDGKDYFFDSKGIMQTGWLKISEDDPLSPPERYYIKKNGELYTGWAHTKSGKMMYFYPSDYPEGKRLVHGYEMIDGQEYYFDPKTGYLGSGWCYYQYFENGAGFVYNCDKTIDGKEYHFDEEGKGILKELVTRKPSEFSMPELCSPMGDALLKCGVGNAYYNKYYNAYYINGTVLVDGDEVSVEAETGHFGDLNIFEMEASGAPADKLMDIFAKEFGCPVDIYYDDNDEWYSVLFQAPYKGSYEHFLTVQANKHDEILSVYIYFGLPEDGLIIDPADIKTGNSAAEKAVVSAAYPETAKYPMLDTSHDDSLTFVDCEKKYKEYLEACNKWRNSKNKTASVSADYRKGTEKFLGSSIKTFLSGSGSENRIYSPINVYMSLGMTAELTGGNTRKQILDLLGNKNIGDLRRQAKNIWEANYIDDGNTYCVSAGSLWLRDDMKYKKSTLDSLAKNYYASSFSGKMGSAEYSNIFRRWLSEQTGGLLEDYISGMEFHPTDIIALAATVNYSGKWVNEFYPGSTNEDIFHTPDEDINCDFMNKSYIKNCLVNDDFVCISLPLENNGSMRLILPAEGSSPEKLLDNDEFTELMINDDSYLNKKCKTYETTLSVPKFDVSSGIDLIDGLEKMGVKDAFVSGKADFSPLTDDSDGVFIGSIEHDARVVIDEEGCRAAAMTVSVSTTAGLYDFEQLDLIFDRPFVFEIMSETGFPLFVGIVNNPNE